MIDIITRKLFIEWNENGIRYCSFKSNEHLYDGMNGKTDIDILIDAENYNLAVEIMKKNRFIEAEPVNVGMYPYVVNWFGMDYSSGVLVHIHLHLEIVTGKSLVKDYILPWKEYFLNNTVIDPDLKVKYVIPTLEYILLCTRIVVKKNIKPAHFHINKEIEKEINYLYDKIDDEDMLHWINIIFPVASIEKDLLSTKSILDFSDRDFSQFYKFIKKTQKKHQRIPEGIALLQSYLNRATRMISRILNYRFNTGLPLKKRFLRGGVSVAFVGIDGSGKSTMVKEIANWLGNEFDIKQFYAGAGDGKKDFLSSLLLKIYGKFGQKMNEQAVIYDTDSNFVKLSRSEELPLKIRIKNFGGAIAYIRILRSNIKKLRKSNELTSRGMICLMDRYPQNSVPFIHDGAKVQKYDAGKGIIHLIANKEKSMLEAIQYSSYDLVIKLLVGEKTAYSRKPLESVDSLRFKAKTLEEIVYDSKEIYSVDADRPFEEVLIDVKRKIWEKCYLK